MKIEPRAPADLIPYPDNPVVHPPEQVDLLVRSIAEYGFTVPILIDADDTVVAGHARLEAARAAGLEAVPTVKLADLSPDQIRAYRIADNRLAELRTWDTALLTTELEALEDTGTLIADDAFIAANRPQPEPEAEQSVAAVPDDPVSKPGDLYVLGRHRLICGDSTDQTVVARLLDGAEPRLMVTDPPYGVEYDPDWRTRAIRSDGTSYRAVGRPVNDDRADWRDAWKLFPGSVVYQWAPPGSDFPTHCEALTAAGFAMRATIIWAKNVAPIGRGHYHVKHEPCIYAVRKGATAKWIGDRKQTTVWEIDKPQKSETGHSTQKPVECMERPIRNHEGDVYDPFLGSGTTLIAAERTGRACFAVELDPGYVDVAVKRWEDYTGGTAVRR